MTIPVVSLRLGQSYVNSDWKNATALVRAQQAVHITRGTPDERGKPDPARCQFTLENTDGKFTPRNPRSAYVDYLGMNVPTRVRTDAGTASTLPSVRDETETTTGNGTTITVDCPTTAEGDILLVFHAYGSAAQFTPTIDGIGWRRLVFFEEPEAYTAGGSAPYKNVVVWYKRVTAVAEDATFTLRQAGTYHGRVVALAIQDAGGFIPMIDWGKTATAAGDDAIQGNIAVLPVRGLQLYTAIKWGNVTIAQDGVVYTDVASVAGGVNQPTVCIVSDSENDNEPWMNPDYTSTDPSRTIGPQASTVFDNDPFDFTAGINLIAADDVRYRAWAEVSGWPQKWTEDGVDATVAVDAGGILQRYAKEPDRSPFERTCLGKHRHLYADMPTDTSVFDVRYDGMFAAWPLRGDLDVIGLGGVGRTLNNASLDYGAMLSPGGNGVTPTVTGVVDAIALPFVGFNVSDDSHNNIGFAFRFESGTTAASHVRVKCNLYSYTAGGQDLSIDVTAAASTFTVTASRVRQDTGASATIGTATLNRNPVDDYHRVWFEWIVTGATYRLVVDGRPVATGTWTANVGAGSPWGEILIWSDISIGQFQAYHRISVSDYPAQWHDLWPATRGHIGETGAERIHRLCREERLSPEAYADPHENRNRLGAQPTGNLADQLADAALADGGILYESVNRLGIAYRPRTDLYWSDVIELTYTDGDLLESPEPLEDDQTILNQVTYTGDGASYSETETAGGRGTIRAGVYAVSGEISTFHRTMLAQRSSWDLYLGTLDEPRYRTLTFNLRQMEANGHTTLAQSLREAKLGDRIRITSLPVWIPPGPVDLLIQGVDETMTNFDHIITFNTRPATPYMPGIIGADDGSVDVHGQRIDASAATLAANIDSDDTTISVTTSLTSRLAAPWVTIA